MPQDRDSPRRFGAALRFANELHAAAGVLAIGEIIGDLNTGHCPRYCELLSRRREWVNDMFHQLCEP